ncbi:hypothetical protein AMECASPLE_033190, partial [Ameca splendens]
VSSQDAWLILVWDAKLLSVEAKEAVGSASGSPKMTSRAPRTQGGWGCVQLHVHTSLSPSLSLLLTHPQSVWPRADAQMAAGYQPSATYSHSGKRPQPDPAHRDQRWPGLTVAESKRPSAGRGLFATKAFSRGEVICDYHE